MTGLKSYTPMPPDARVAWTAAVQHGVVDYEALLAAGVKRGGVDRRVEAGWLHRKYVGVFAVGHPGLSERGEWIAAVLAGGPTAVLSHGSAAAFWGLAPAPRDRHITVPRKHRRGPTGITLHANALHRLDWLVEDAIRITNVARTLLDCAETATTKELVEMIDRATARRLFDARAIRAVMERARGRKGLARLREAILVTRPQDILTRSELERRALKLIKSAKLPTPEVNVKVGRFEVDLLWRDQRLVAELDSRAHHAAWDAQQRDRRRDLELLTLGWSTARLTWRDIVNQPAWVAGQLRKLL